METKFRPIPITILDILAIFLPGFVWLILIITAFEVIGHVRGDKVPTPVLAWDDIVLSLKNAKTWLAPFPLLAASLLLGYLLKPGAIVITELFATQVTIRLRYRKLLAEDEGKGLPEVMRKAIRKGAFRRLDFPFNDLFKKNPLYQAVDKILVEKLDCVVSGDKKLSAEVFPGSQIFATAKRYLKVISPALWEETERREAEVRMAGVMYLAFVFSLVLSVLAFPPAFAHGDGKLNVAGWFVLSAVGIIVAGESFNLLRVSEVGYTYLNMLVADRCSPAVGADRGGVTPKAEAT